MGFKSPEEYILFDELRKKDIDVKHNVYIRGMEVDLFIPPKLVIEIGYRDDALMKKWDYFEKEGFSFKYFSNMAIRDTDSLKSCVRQVMAAIYTEGDDSAQNEEEENPPALNTLDEGVPNLNRLTTYDKTQFKKLRSYLNRCKQILESEIDKLDNLHYRTPNLEEERKAEIRDYRDTIKLMNKLLSRI